MGLGSGGYYLLLKFYLLLTFSHKHDFDYSLYNAIKIFIVKYYYCKC